MSDTPQELTVVRDRARWPWWKILLAYALMFAIAMLSIWMIDGHVMKVTHEAARRAGF
jgi:hypothetical protein